MHCTYTNISASQVPVIYAGKWDKEEIIIGDLDVYSTRLFFIKILFLTLAVNIA